MASVAEWLEGNLRHEKPDLGPHALDGTVAGTSVSVRFSTESHGSITIWRTEVAVPYTAGTPEIQLAIRSDQPVHERFLRKGLMRNLELGDPEFDQDFVVDGAPADIVRELFDAATRATMLALLPIAIWTESRALVVGRTDWVRDTAELERLIQFAIDFVRRIEPAATEATARQRELGPQTAYRDFKTTDEIANDRAEDIRARQSIDTRREDALRRERVVVTRVVLSIFVATIIAVGAWLLRQSG